MSIETAPTHDRLDDLMSSFFQAQMPRPWPAAPRPLARPIPALTASRTTDPDDSLSHSRMALALSVAVLLGSCWYLSHQTPNAAPAVQKGLNFDNGQATTEVLNQFKDKGKPQRNELPKME